MSQPEGESKHLRISRLLREAIRSGSHPIGSRLPSEARLVQQHGVSRPTVMRALNDLEAEGLRLLQVRRDWDSRFWPHATAGFFAFRKRIPEGLGTGAAR